MLPKETSIFFKLHHGVATSQDVERPTIEEKTVSLIPAVSFEMDLKTTVDSNWLPGASRVQRLLHQMNIWWNLE